VISEVFVFSVVMFFSGFYQMVFHHHEKFTSMDGSSDDFSVVKKPPHFSQTAKSKIYTP